MDLDRDDLDGDLDVAVVGGGIAGLAAAHAARASGGRVRVFEAADHVGGRMSTLRVDGFLADTGAEQLPERGYDATWSLLAELGVDRADVPLIGRRVGMWRGGRVRPGVADALGLLTGAGLGLRARLDARRALGSGHDLDRPEDSGTATVVEHLARYHRDVLEYLLQPVVSGFFGWRPERSAAGPALALLGSVGTASTWRVYPDGMDSLARALADRLDVETSARVNEVVADRDGARLVVGGREVPARRVVLAVPAPVALDLHANPPEREAEFLRACTFTPVVKVHLLLDRPLPSAAYLVTVPRAESDVVSAIAFDHLKHPGRAPEGKGLLTVIANPVLAPRLARLPDADVADMLTRATEKFAPGLGEAVTGALVHRFRHGLPEATPRALGLRAGFDAALGSSTVDYAGDWVLLSPCSEAAVRTGLRAGARAVARRGELV